MKANSSDTNHARRAAATITLHDTMTVMPSALAVGITKREWTGVDTLVAVPLVVTIAVLAVGLVYRWLT